MILVRYLICHSLALSLLLLLSSAAKTDEISVSLFHQNCKMSGPLSQSLLKSIHAISPDQLTSGETSALLRNSLAQLQKASGIPAALDRYREKMAKYLEANISFYDGVERATKSGKVEPFLEITRKYMNGSPRTEFETTAKKVGVKNLDSLRDPFNELAQPNPEEEFHRAIRKMKLKYDCSYEEDDAE